LPVFQAELGASVLLSRKSSQKSLKTDRHQSFREALPFACSAGCHGTWLGRVGGIELFLGSAAKIFIQQNFFQFHAAKHLQLS
jgi:hypothetical protein